VRRALAVVHQRDAGPGVFEAAAAARGVELERWHPAEGEPAPSPSGYAAVLSFGGAMHVDQEDRHPWLAAEKRLLAELLAAETPLLGVCLGSQLLAEAAGGAPHRAREPEIGWRAVELTAEGERDPLLGILPRRFEAFQWHSYEAGAPPAAAALARSPVCRQAYRVAERAWGIQFHAEVSPDDAAAWIRDYRSDEDAVRIGVDPETLGAETTAKIAAWNDLGRRLCERFFELAA
jgi:GMP synthase (glutamine-hydrolysing)